MKTFFTFKLLPLALLVGMIAVPLMVVPMHSQAPYTVQAPTAKVNLQNAANTFTFAAAVGDATNQTYITITAKDRSGNLVPRAVFDVYLSDSSVGTGVTATASSGTAGLLIANGTGGAGSMTGFPVSTSAASPNVASSRVPMRIGTNASGVAKIGIIDSSKTLFVPCAVNIYGTAVCGTALTTAAYK